MEGCYLYKKIAEKIAGDPRNYLWFNNEIKLRMVVSGAVDGDKLGQAGRNITHLYIISICIIVFSCIIKIWSLLLSMLFNR